MLGFFTSAVLTLFFLLGGATSDHMQEDLTGEIRYIPCYDTSPGPRDWKPQVLESLTPHDQVRAQCLAKFPASMQAGFDCEKMRELHWLLSSDIDLLTFVRNLQRNKDNGSVQAGLKKAIKYLSENKEKTISIQDRYHPLSRQLDNAKLQQVFMILGGLFTPNKSASDALDKKLESSDFLIKNAEIKINQRLQEEVANPTAFMGRYAQRISDLDYQLDQLQQIQRLIEDGKTGKANESLKSLEGRLKANLQKHDFKQSPHKNEYGAIESR